MIYISLLYNCAAEETVAKEERQTERDRGKRH
jgi:hypothetical protein